MSWIRAWLSRHLYHYRELLVNGSAVAHGDKAGLDNGIAHFRLTILDWQLRPNRS
jgi:hypothetical protein